MTEKFSFSNRTDWPLESNEIMVELQELKKKNVEVFDLSESNPTRCGFDYPKDDLLQVLTDPQNLQYAPLAQGAQEAREALAHDYEDKNLPVSPDRIYLTSSTSEAYSFLFRLLINPGEAVLFPRPSYPLFQYLVDLNDAEMQTYPLTYQNDQWTIDFEALEKAVTAKTKAIIMVNPNNPTGSFIHQPCLNRLNELCKKHHLALICDEVFFDYPLGKQARAPVSLVNNHEVLTFVLGGLSKSLALPQMKLAWIVVSGPDPLVQSAGDRLEVILDTFLSVNTPAQNALNRWFAFRSEIQAEVLKRIAENWNFLLAEFEDLNDCRCFTPEGGWYAVLKLPDQWTEEEWVLEFLRHDHVFVHPGYFFDFYDQPYMVVSLLPHPEIFREGLQRMVRRMKSKLAEAGVS